MINKELWSKMPQEDKKRLMIKGGLAAVIVVCLIAIIVYFVQINSGEQVYEELQANVVISAEVESTEAGEIPADMPDVNFDSLWETNLDICAWIYIPGTQVNYPVLRNREATDPHDAYYLDHTVNKGEGLPGAIYMEPCNMPDFTDNNTVLYGHHMKNRSMFATLDEYQDAEFMAENPYAYIVTPQKDMVYRIYGAVVYDDTHIMRSFDFTDDASYQEYLTSLVENDNEKDVLSEADKVTTDDRVLTLSTCIKNEDELRLLIVAVLEDEYER